MKDTDFKDAINGNAERIIAKELSIKEEGGSYPCKITKHRKGNLARMVWFDTGDTQQNTFFCHDCNESYDIITHANKHHSDDKSYLSKLAKGKSAKPKPKKKVQVIKDFSKLDEVQSLSSELSDEAYEWLESRGISKHVAGVYGITGDSNNCHFNYYIPVDSEEEFRLVNLKSRRLGDVENGDNKYFAQKGGSAVLYGMHTYVSQRILIICEGEVDCISFYEGVHYKSAQEHVCVVSVPTGTSHSWVESCRSFLDKFQRIVIVADSDEAGIKFREGCFERLDFCPDVQWIDMGEVLPNGKKFNDVNDYLRLSGKLKTSQLMSRMEVINHDCGFNASKIVRKGGAGHIKTGFFGLDRAIQGLRIHDLSMFLGDSNDGKSTIMRQLIGYVVKQGYGVGCMMGEEQDDKFMDLMIRQQYHDGLMYNSTLNDWGDKQYAPNEEVTARWKYEFGSHINIFQQGKVDGNEITEKLCEWITHCSDIEGKQLFIIDNLMKLTAAHPKEEFVAQGEIIEALYRLVDTKPIHIIIVAHTKKIDGLMDANSVSGSKKLINTPDNVFTFQRIDRYIDSKTNSKAPTKEQAYQIQSFKAGLAPKPNGDTWNEPYDGPYFESYIDCMKIRDRNAGYEKTVHCYKYDKDTATLHEQLPSTSANKEALDKYYKEGYTDLVKTKPQIGA